MGVRSPLHPVPTLAKSLLSVDDGGMATPSPRWSHPAVVLATSLWLGRIPWAPGTWGAAVGIPLSMGITHAALLAGGGPTTVALVVELGLVVLVCALGIPVCTAAADALGGRKDPGAINLDEAASMPLALLVLPFEARTAMTMLLAFLLFRFFDILKPFPCRQLEQLPGGCGIMADDWGAAVWTGCCLALLSLAGWLPG
jgi:phosphatidylglycerophosphatase A